MSKIIEYYYSHVSPFSFLGHQGLLSIAERTGATIAYHPISVMEIFPKTGGVPVAKRAPERRAYRMVELKRWSKHLGIEMNFEPKNFPMDDRPAQKFALAAADLGADLGVLSYEILKGVWQEEKIVADLDVLTAIADSIGLDGAAIASAAGSDAIAAKAEATHQKALTVGVFGMPWFVFNGESFWGQDRLDLLEIAIGESA